MTLRRNVLKTLDLLLRSSDFRRTNSSGAQLFRRTYLMICTLELIFLKKMGTSGSGSIAIRTSPTMSTTISSKIFLSLVEATAL
ncbi:hypothetical protein PFISCL1PPCAC_17701 [Pristionchus fissidentatus]|uniref:Ribosomal protein n=1 Tax=Pristionchus fissidentatus TaxID=1538716 RepID=A0AAV5W390_9BILA|nr:hypothetical protein PFISCL1PPCAC_17701 [Pristionchus fissidentatus]